MTYVHGQSGDLQLELGLAVETHARARVDLGREPSRDVMPSIAANSGDQL